MKSKVILLVEDNPDDVALTKRALDKSHIANKLIVAEDGEEALDYLFGTGMYEGRDTNSLPAIVLLDLKLPKVNGYEVLQKIREDKRTKRLPVVVLTSSNEQHDVSSCYDIGANSYIRKPVDFIQFSEAVKHLGLYWLVINETPPLP
jgi:two-component system, response regulator